jgi:hypothetical protein
MAIPFNQGGHRSIGWMSSVREPPSSQAETSVTKSMGDALYVIDRGRTESLPMEVEDRA